MNIRAKRKKKGKNMKGKRMYKRKMGRDKIDVKDSMQKNTSPNNV